MTKKTVLMFSAIAVLTAVLSYYGWSEYQKAQKAADLEKSLIKIDEANKRVQNADRQLCRTVSNLTGNSTKTSIADIAPWYQAQIDRNSQEMWVHSMVQIYLDKHITNLELLGSLGANNTTVQLLTKSYLNLKNECSDLGVSLN